MNTLRYKSKFANSGNVSRNWYIIDAEGEIVGRLASKVANLIRGKYKADFTPHYNSGDKVIVINAEKVRFTGRKWDLKIYRRHSNYPGGLKLKTAKQMLDHKPTEIIRKAVSGMLPKNKLQKVYLENLFIYTGTEHPHSAQKPQSIEI